MAKTKDGKRHKGPEIPWPYGWTMRPDPAEQRIIKRIVKLSEEYSQRAIADMFNKEGLRIRGRRWHQGTISRILERADNGASY